MYAIETKHHHLVVQFQMIGADRQPSIYDRDSMPYSVATIIELLRYSALVTSLPHVALEDARMEVMKFIVHRNNVLSVFLLP